MVDQGKKKRGANYNQNDGVSGVVYILGNRAFKFNYRKIGCSRYSGKKRATDLNKAATTGTPAHFFCVFEQKTLDCGLAEKRVFQRLAAYRKGKSGQEYFCLPLDEAKAAVIEECKKVDTEYTERQKLKGRPKIVGSRVMSGRYDALKELEE